MRNMEGETRRLIGEKRNKWGYTLLLCAIGLLINIGGAQLALRLHLPLYLDNIGSALIAAIGGFIPGIIVGFLTNMINGISDVSSIYYGSLTVMIAVCSAYFAGRGYYRKLSRLPVIILVFALIGGGIGSVLTWAIFGFSFGDGISAGLAQQIYATGALSEFGSQFAADMLIDLADKTITVLLVALALRLIPERIQALFTFSGWKQAPLSIKELARNMKKNRKHSLRRKVILLVAVATLITAVSVTVISFFHFRNASIEDQKALAWSISQVISDAIDRDRVDEFIEKGEEAEGYRETKDLLKSLMDSSDYIEFCYVYRILEDGCHVVFDPDTDEVPGAAPGEVVAFDEAFRDYLPALLAGKDIVPVESNETYGWLLTVYRPMYDSNGVCQCYAAVDINMNHIARDGYQFLARVTSLFLGFFIMILTAAIWLAEYNVILPINSMAYVATHNDFESEESRAQAVENIEKLKIHTNDEIENLYSSMIKSTRDMVQTTEDMARYIAQMQKQSEVIGKLQNGMILVLADMVESRDQNTGEHVRKTAAYTEIIMRELRREHIYEDELTDKFIQDVFHSAPLHDVGKIQVPDAILNKPGKLTDEEFATMKTHTTEGAKIITSAIEMVSEENSGYLKEARNLAHYHHEKWNGTGYPCGLKGTDIPLSARVMAVADVFDALVSKRSYKDGFPFEKAMSIIREGSGTHFDPNVAEAFLRSENEVREVMESQMGRT